MITINKIQSELNRAKAQLEQLKESEIFTDADREILIPRYKAEIRLLNQKLKTYVH